MLTEIPLKDRKLNFKEINVVTTLILMMRMRTSFETDPFGIVYMKQGKTKWG